jgi:hypothetical protein
MEMIMAIRVQWDNPDKTILRFTYDREWAWDEVYSALEEKRRLLGTVQHPVDTLVDMRAVVTIPVGALIHARRLAEQANGNERVTLVVGANPFILSLVDLVRNLHPAFIKNYRFVSTLNDAYTLLNHQRSANV